MQWKNTPVLVTGCTGLLGSWLCKELIWRKARVVGLIRDWVPKSALIKDRYIDEMDIVRGDICDFQTIERIINEYEIEVVFHLAAQTIVEIANRNPLSTFESNIKGTWNVLEACRRVPTVKKIIVASSDKAYGDQPLLPYDEGMPLQGTHPYDVSKSCADLIAKTYHTTYGTPVCITRCGNFYGGGDLNFNRLVPGTIRALLNDEQPVIRSDGSYIRDYFYVEDGVHAYLHLAEKMDDEKILGEAFNFSNELQISVLELVEKIISLMGKENIKPKVLGTARNEIIHQSLSAEKARKMLEWAPAYTLDEALERTIDWYKKFFEES
ncbi:sugar dehydratase [Methanosarcina sp. 1.H.T.1A.1]|uniref:GDP-mannose 4,6-dehydratase n=1 Tax=Methanosarcina sp. 1.H.T.1A.1 TaxID=1483602 RepID=UPI000622B24C|nr:GDP-mannose 4,6-dehydratase [Methanosarcina sp. 1.H.T.1A.1]KKH95139.1 sugar dehydratase [Methanosarcina sp. 1.H.T.1A.1]